MGTLGQSIWVEDWYNFGADYDATLIAWFKNFDSSWHKLKEKYDERFYRMWKYYLLSSAGTFRSRHMHVWQIVFSKKGVPKADTVQSDSEELDLNGEGK